MATAGRKKPYTEIGLRRLKCCRCEEKADSQWNCCANGNRWLPLCAQCDVLLNRLVMEYFNFPKRQVGKIMATYIRNRIQRSK